jgi:SAM-dependent methyltransferase
MSPPGAGLRLLDIGGANSLYPLMMTEWGSVTVIEPDEDAIDVARAVLRADIRKGSLPDDLDVDGPFDVITMLDVLEHVADDGRALEAVRALLAPDGRAIITVPALPVLYSDHDRVLHHFRRYTGRTLRVAVETADLRLERMSYWTSLLLPLVAVQRTASRIRSALVPGRKLEYSVKTPRKGLNTLLGGVMSVERRLLRNVRMPVGSSLFAVVRRARPGNSGSEPPPAP